MALELIPRRCSRQKNDEYFHLRSERASIALIPTLERTWRARRRTRLYGGQRIKSSRLARCRRRQGANYPGNFIAGSTYSVHVTRPRCLAPRATRNYMPRARRVFAERVSAISKMVTRIYQHRDNSSEAFLAAPPRDAEIESDKSSVNCVRDANIVASATIINLSPCGGRKDPPLRGSIDDVGRRWLIHLLRSARIIPDGEVRATSAFEISIAH